MPATFENHLGRAPRRNTQVVIRGAIVKRANSPVDRVSHHREVLAISAPVDKSISGGVVGHNTRSEEKLSKKKVPVPLKHLSCNWSDTESGEPTKSRTRPSTDHEHFASSHLSSSPEPSIIVLLCNALRHISLVELRPDVQRPAANRQRRPAMS